MRRSASLTLLCATCLIAACSQAPTRRAQPAPPAPAQAGIELLQARAGLYSAGQPAPSDWPGIAARGVRTVINLRTPEEMGGRDEAAEVRVAGMAYVQLPVDGAEGITPERASALAALLREAKGDVLVHCHSANRAGGLLALMRAQEEGVAPAEALEFGRKAGMRSTEGRVRGLLGLPPAE